MRPVIILEASGNWKDKLKTSVKDKFKEFKYILRETSVEAVKTIIHIFKIFKIINCALFLKPIMWYTNCQ